MLTTILVILGIASFLSFSTFGFTHEEVLKDIKTLESYDFNPDDINYHRSLIRKRDRNRLGMLTSIVCLFVILAIFLLTR